MAIRGLLASIAIGPMASAFAACDAPKLQSPSGKIVERQAGLAWDAVPEATGYRVRLLSRVPNGRVVASHDTVVSEPRFMPPQALADLNAKVVVRLNAICGKDASAESVSSFVIDTSPACVMGEVSAAMAA